MHQLVAAPASEMCVAPSLARTSSRVVFSNAELNSLWINGSLSAGANSGYYKNPTVDNLLRASTVADSQTLVKNFKTIQDITSRVDPPAIWIGEPQQVNIFRSEI